MRDGMPPAKQRRDDFWRPFLAADTVYTNDPDDGHKHDYAAVSPKSLGAFGPTCVVGLACGWIKSWGDPLAV